jgi:cytochrome c-type biogenesis protein CcmH
VMRLSKIRTSTAALIIVVCAYALAIPIVLAAAPTVGLQEVSEGLTCQCGCGLTVANCNHPNCEFSVPVRDQIGTMLGRGMSGPQVIAFFRAEYGEKILSAPTAQGFNLLAWIMPFAVILAGGVLVAFTVGRSHSNSPSTGPADAVVSESEPNGDNFDSELRRRLDHELHDRI